jgi:hypothetical protein
MSDPTNTEFLHTELRRQLHPVAAPEALWERIQDSRTHSRSRSKYPVRRVWAVPVLATLLVLLTAGLLWGIRQSRTHLSDFAQLTDQDLSTLADASNGESLLSGDPSEIRNWVKAKGNIDIELPSGPSRAVRLLGTKLVQLRGTLIAAVAYRVGNVSATLLVSRRTACCNQSAGTNHLFSKAGTTRGESLVSWNMREQSYTIAWTGAADSQSACLLCHADVHARL